MNEQISILGSFDILEILMFISDMLNTIVVIFLKLEVMIELFSFPIILINNKIMTRKYQRPKSNVISLKRVLEISN
jgi:hypothetical protein